MQRNLVKMFSLLLGLVLFTGLCWADEGVTEVKEEAQSKSLAAIEFLSGYSKANLKRGGNYTTVPIIVDFDFDLKPLTKKIGFNPPMLLQFLVEPSISPVIEKNANVELGLGFILKVGLLPETSKFQPYIKAGPGLLYTTQHTQLQGTQFNFFEYAGIGAHYFFTKNTAFTIEGRYRHVSNCGIKDPNTGINSYFGLLGVAYQF
ncbi:MAG: acyloxyacyl hydrolase [Candidatus Omnitrophica bacterium]|nr:acyloxyacyl hydrolase [Candidatus Omnitrophota bacterium]